MEQFEAFFRKADLDGDGRISGAEAVAFFQASGLPKPVLAQIWMHADQSKTGFLGRPEFYNALRLVTVAQSKRDLTPEIVKAALYGPAASKIPPPQINPRPAGPPQNLGPRGPNANVYVPAQPNPNPNPMPTASQASSNMWPSGPSSVAPRPQPSKPLVVSGNGIPSTSGFGNDALPRSGPRPPNTPVNMLQPKASVDLNQQASTPGSTLIAASVGAGLPWPKMKSADVQKYTKVFMEVDADRDGRITGEEARNLFLSWRLPREILKQVWDLSDQDNDSMLSLREFCFALYLMERFREGRPLPSLLPNSLLFDETLTSMTSQPKVNYGSANPGAGFGQQPRGSAPNSRQRPGALEDSFLDQRPQNGQRPAVSAQKVEDTKNLIMDSKEKLELYRTKMQELVLYKSRCDNKLNEITERALADKREAESLGKKYEERYKQVAEIASKLTIEEATFRDIQERKTELNQAIIRMEQGGSVDGILQVRADRIQYDLEELVKALNERCKKHGLDVKSSAVIELPNGWEPGIQEGTAVWDEDWDKFEDEGFLNDLTVDVKNVSPAPSVQKELASPDGAFDTDSVFAPTEHDYANESPAGGSSGAFSDGHHRKDSDADAEIHRSFDDSTWSAFDNNDDMDSVWGFGDQRTNDVESEKHRDMFGSDSFSVRTGSPNGSSSAFGRKGAFNFDDSVPSTPMSRYSDAGDHYFDNFSRFDEGGFSAAQPESLTRFDSMNSTTTGPFSRFDSISSSTDFGTRFDSSSRDFGHNATAERLTRFDSINSSKDFGFGDSDPFKVSSPKKGSDNWNAF